MGAETPGSVRTLRAVIPGCHMLETTGRNAYRAVRYLMARRVFRRATAFTAVSPYMAEAVRRYTLTDPLPANIQLDPMSLYNATYDATTRTVRSEFTLRAARSVITSP